MRFRGSYILVVLLAVGLTAVWYYLKLKQETEIPQEPVAPVVEEVEKIIESDWVSFSVPKQVVNPEWTLQMKVLKPVDRIEVLWSHPAVPPAERYVLKSFQPNTSEATYHIGASLGNLLPGKNTYEVIGVGGEDTSVQQEMKTRFELEFDLKSYPEIQPSFFTFYPYATETDSASVAVRGVLRNGVDQVRVYSFHPRDGRSHFTVLNKYVPQEKNFEYFVDEKLENFSIGENEYVIEAVDEAKEVVARKYFTIRSTKLTLEDKVTSLFGEFQLVKGGWYVSSSLPWFSFRPIYESVWIPEEEGKIVVARPTLMYSYDTELETPLCDYLKEVDYEKENYSYEAYSFETCQKYRYGVSVYDRFLSLLTYQPFELVKRTDYESIKSTASSAFVMIETGGMKSSEVVNPEIDEETPATSEEVSEEEVPKKKYFIYQMMITDQVPYEDKKIGDIAVEITPELQQQMEQVKSFLNTYSGDELFSQWVLSEETTASTPPEAE